MSRLPVLKPYQVVSLLEALGFIEVRQRGAHKQFRHAEGRGTTVPFHQGQDISPVLLRKIARDIGTSAEELLARGDDRTPPGETLTLVHPNARRSDPPRPAPSGADLHVHTTHSDGVCSPCEVVNAASAVGLAALAITDHDSVSALAVARPEAARLGVELIGGVEWTAELDGREVHILGHFLRDDAPGVVGASRRLRAARVDRLAAMAERLAGLGLSVDLGGLQRAFPRATLGRRHLADWLTRTGQVSGPREAFARFLGDGGPAEVPKPRLDWTEAVALTVAAGGVAALAHPPYNLREATLRMLAEGGLGAVEVGGPGINANLGRRWRAWADAIGLIPVLGSDFHAQDRPGRRVGASFTPDADLERLRARASNAVLRPGTNGYNVAPPGSPGAVSE